MEERIKSLEREKKKRERSERRNVVVKDFKEIEGDARNGLEKVFKKIGANVRMEEIRIVRMGKEERGGMTIVKLGKGDKKEVMEKKKELTGGRVWIEDDVRGEKVEMEV